MTIEIKDFLIDQLNQEELNELTLGLLSYKMNNVIPEFSSKLITISFLFSINDIVINQQKENIKKSRSEINRQNVMNRWHNKKRNIMLDDDNTYTNNAKSDTISNTKSDTKSDTKIIQNYTNENIVENIDNKAENNKKSIIQTHTNTIQNLYEQSDTKMDTKSVQKDIQNDTEIIQNNLNEEVIKKIDNFEEFKNKEITQNNINSDAKDNINISTRDNAKDDKNLKQLLNEFVTLKASENKVDSKKNIEHTKAKPKLPDIIRDDKGEGKAMKSVANILSGMKITITRVEDLPVLEDAIPETTECSQEDKYIKSKQDKNNKNDFEINMQQIDIVSIQDKNNKKDFKTDIQQINTKLKQDKNNKNDSDTDLLNLKDTQNQIKNNKNLKEKESNKEKENNIYIYNNIYNNKNNNNNNNIYNNISEYSLERGCGGKPFLNDDNLSVIDATVLYAGPNENISDAEAIVEYVEPVSTPKKKKNEFIPPLIEEIEKYCQDKKLNVDTEHWYNYYEANDWKVNNRGKLVPMKNWKQALLTWHSNNKHYNKPKANNDSVYSRKMTEEEIAECIAITERDYEALMGNISKG